MLRWPHLSPELWKYNNTQQTKSYLILLDNQFSKKAQFSIKEMKDYLIYLNDINFPPEQREIIILLFSVIVLFCSVKQ